MYAFLFVLILNPLLSILKSDDKTMISKKLNSDKGLFSSLLINYFKDNYLELMAKNPKDVLTQLRFSTYTDEFGYQACIPNPKDKKNKLSV